MVGPKAMLGAAVALMALGAVSSVPTSGLGERRKEEEEGVSGLVAVANKPQGEARLGTFMPFVSEIVTYAAAVVPTAKARRFKHRPEFEALLLQTDAPPSMNASAPSGEEGPPTGAETLRRMQKMGAKVQALVGYDPVAFMTDLLGEKGTADMIDSIVGFELKFPDTITEEQVGHAEMMLLTLGVYGPESDKNEKATQDFMNSMSKQQTDMIYDLQKNVIERLTTVMMKEDGSPTDAVIQETEKQLKAIEESPVGKFVNMAMAEDLVADDGTFGFAASLL